jgi:lysophospholipase L1-like esterase
MFLLPPQQPWYSLVTREQKCGPLRQNSKGFSFVNRGINTQTSAQVLGRFDKHVVPLHPNIVIVQVGINDLKTIPAIS